MSRYVGRHRALPTLRRRSQVATRAGVGLTTAALGLTLPVAMAPTASAAAAPAVHAPAAPAKPFTGLLKQGSRGPLVVSVQKKVGVSADGVYGPRTASAVKRFQKKHRLAADGVVGPATAKAMRLTGSAPKPAPKKSVTKKPAAKKTAKKPTSSATKGARVVNTAKSLVGAPYRYGGTTPRGFDCSGMTGYVLKKHGVNLPRTAEAQRQRAHRTSSPRQGDLVFFGAPAYHVGIYAGGGKIVDAGSSGGRVSQRPLWTTAVSYGRVL